MRGPAERHRKKPSRISWCVFFVAILREIVVIYEIILLMQSPPGFPNTPAPCEMSVETKPTTCQVRVDLVDLALAPPVRASGRCRQSSHLAVSVPEGGRKVFGRGFSAFCGTNTGQHFYMDVTVPKQVCGKIGLVLLRGHCQSSHFIHLNCWIGKALHRRCSWPQRS